MIVLLVHAALLVVVGYASRGLWEGGPPAENIAVTVPELSPAAREGREAFDRRCAECHGRHAAGTAVGPPLVHPVYRSAHHADGAFVLAVGRGVLAHHWRFGDMPHSLGCRRPRSRRSPAMCASSNGRMGSNDPLVSLCRAAAACGSGAPDCVCTGKSMGSAWVPTG